AADQLILALPFSTLRLVDMSGLNLSPVKNRTIKEWGYGTNAKLMLGFSSRPWRTGPLQSSGSVYSNLQSQCFWETSHNQPGKSGIITNYLGGDSGRIMSGGAKLKSLADLAQIFVGVNKFFDGKSVLQHWPSHPFTLGSFTCSLPGQYTSIYGAAGEPELNGRLLFAGEHTSIDFSGFMNGAVESGNTVAQQIVMQKTKRAAAAAANPTDP
ncbi:MAG: FAD-dependent oxidoreductase, partial [Proteobacteria bacterium]|nr:FAD-dependent oxidoreductase [Pseudomonadota bacterium]